ncbi:MAG: hypothetical protein M3024_07860 [Candidatus Dormibacteraeota bacterium]|nr:hypothetical protein [Candidatus Dormibacteraeota bacterium]
MTPAEQTQLAYAAIFVLVIFFAMRRRMRPQPVRPARLLISGGIIVLVILAGLIPTGGRIFSDPLALALVPVFLLAGIGFGFVLVRTMTFWNDPQTGVLWMKGGAIFASILLATIALRTVGRFLVTGSVDYGSGSATGASPRGGLLYDLAGDLLFLSLGLWASRATFIFLRYRGNQAPAPAATAQDAGAAPPPFS